MWVDSVQKTDVGKKRTNNEDNLAVIESDNITVLAVADGMGGHQSGELASLMAVEGLEDLPAQLADDDQDSEILFKIEMFIQELNSKIHSASGEEDARRHMGTTLSIAVIKGDRLYIGHIGDSRIYRLRGDIIEQLTDDHSFVGEQVRIGVLTEEEAEKHPNRNIITRALGIRPEARPDTLGLAVEMGDIYLLCSDGLTGHLKKDELANILLENADLEGAMDNMVNLALERGGTDNITVIIGKIVDVPPKRENKNDKAQGGLICRLRAWLRGFGG